MSRADENPFAAPQECSPPVMAEAVDDRAPDGDVMSDLVFGVNLRVRDNLLQAAAVFFGLIVGAGGGYFAAGLAGLVVGAMAGIVVGLFGSGIYLMVYHATRRLKRPKG